MEKTTQVTDNEPKTIEANPASSQPQLAQTDKKPTRLIVATAFFAILAVAGISFGVYELLDSNQKNQQISDLKSKIENKNSEIEELETTISSLQTETKENNSSSETTNTEPATNSTTKTATITLGSILDENETRTVYKIGDCTADGPSVKCPVNVNGKEALFSYINTEGILRFTLPKE